MTVLAQSFFALVRCHLVAFAFLSVRHISKMLIVNYMFLSTIVIYFTWSMNTLAGLKAGILCSGMMMTVFLLILRAVFCERVFTIKLPKPRR